MTAPGARDGRSKTTGHTGYTGHTANPCPHTQELS